MWSTGFAGFVPHILQDSGNEGVSIAGHARWAEVGGGIVCVTLQEVHWFAQKRAPHAFRVMEVIPFVQCCILLAFVGLPSLHGHHAYMAC